MGDGPEWKAQEELKHQFGTGKNHQKSFLMNYSPFSLAPHHLQLCLHDNKVRENGLKNQCKL